MQPGDGEVGGVGGEIFVVDVDAVEGVVVDELGETGRGFGGVEVGGCWGV